MDVKHLIAVAADAAAAVCGAGSPLAPYFSSLSEGTDPGTVSRRITDQYLSTRPENYRPKGYHGNEGCDPVRTEFELTYPAWGGFGEETHRVTLDRGQFFAHFRPRFRGRAPTGVQVGVQVGPSLDCDTARRHDGRVVRDFAAALRHPVKVSVR